MMRWGVVALGIALFAASCALPCVSNVRAATDTFSNLGEGLTSCGEWLDKRRQTPSRVIPEAAWCLGSSPPPASIMWRVPAILYADWRAAVSIIG